MSGVLNVPVPLFFASLPVSLGDGTSTQGFRWGPARGQLQVSSSPKFAEHQVHTSNMSTGLLQAPSGPQISKMGSPQTRVHCASAPAQACQLLCSGSLL